MVLKSSMPYYCNQQQKNEARVERYCTSRCGLLLFRVCFVCFYKSVHFCFFRGAGAWCSSTHRIASSNTVLRPFCVSAEHSRYL